MALIVEDGTGLSNAEAYTSVSAANTYIAANKLSTTTWDAATTAQKEVAARMATQYLDGVYRWAGEVETSTQALRWPRLGVYDEYGTQLDGIPTKLANACAELMYRAINGDALTNDVTRDAQVRRTKVDVIEVEYENGASQQPSFPEVNRLLMGMYLSSNRVIRG